MAFKKKKEITITDLSKLRRIDRLPKLDDLGKIFSKEIDSLSEHGLTLGVFVLNKTLGSDKKFNPDDQMVLDAINSYLILRYSAIIDSFFHVLFKYNFNHRKLDLDYLFDNTTLPKTPFSKGTVISSQHDFQNWDNINRYMTLIIGLPFKETFMRFVKKRRKKDFDRYSAKIQLEQIWPEFEKLFNFRHKMAHSIKSIKIDERIVRVIGIELETFFYVVRMMNIGVLNLEKKKIQNSKYKEEFDKELERLTIFKF